MHKFPSRIEINPRVLGGKPVIKGTRIPVYIILQMLRDGATFDEILKGYPRIEKDDIKAVLEYALYLVTYDGEDEIGLSQEF
ncbi:MAG: DUF433 domain-containing protein [Candidatus Hodarchaeales archaeon]